MKVAVFGLAGSGKSEVSRVLVEDLGFKSIAFADPLKKFCGQVFEFTDEQLYGPSSARNATIGRYTLACAWDEARERFYRYAPEWLAEINLPTAMPALIAWFEWLRVCEETLSPRLALQRLGTEFGRRVRPTIWVDCAMARAAHLGDVVITDARFRNELDGLRAAGGKALRVIRPGSGLDGAAGEHVSEVEQRSIPNTDFDAVINNAGTLAELGHAVRTIVRDWRFAHAA